MSFTISAGQYDSTLVATTPGAVRVSDLRYPTLEAAMMDLARVMPGDTKAVYRDPLFGWLPGPVQWKGYENRTRSGHVR